MIIIYRRKWFQHSDMASPTVKQVKIHFISYLSNSGDIIFLNVELDYFNRSKSLDTCTLVGEYSITLQIPNLLKTHILYGSSFVLIFIDMFVFLWTSFLHLQFDRKGDSEVQNFKADYKNGRNLWDRWNFVHINR